MTGDRSANASDNAAAIGRVVLLLAEHYLRTWVADLPTTSAPLAPVRGAEWLGKRVRVYAGFDRQKQYPPMAEGEVIGYIGGPSVIVRDADGNQNAWPVSLPIEESQ